MFSLRLSLLRLGGKTYGGCLPDASQMPSDASQMPFRSLSDASSLNDFFSMIFFSMIPPQGSLLYHRSSNESPSMIPLDRFLFHDSSNGFTKKLCLGSRAGVILLLYYYFNFIMILCFCSCVENMSIV